MKTLKVLEFHVDSNPSFGAAYNDLHGDVGYDVHFTLRTSLESPCSASQLILMYENEYILLENFVWHESTFFDDGDGEKARVFGTCSNARFVKSKAEFGNLLL